MTLFDNINKEEKNKILKHLNARMMFFKKSMTILSNVSNSNTLSYISSGQVHITRIDYYGNKTIISTLNEGDIFGPTMFSLNNNEIFIVAASDTEVIMFDYELLIAPSKSHILIQQRLIDNLFNKVVEFLNNSYERIQVLTKKTIRDKLLEYFKTLSHKRGSKKFKLPMSFVEIADYLAIDRSAMMREIKNLKEEGFIEIENKIVKIYF